MKKYLLLVFALISSFGFSQQVLKRITDTPNYTIVDLYAFRNGTSTGNVVGNSNFDRSNTQSIGTIVIDLVNEVVYEKYIADLTLIAYLKVEYPSILNAGSMSYSIEKGLQKMKSNISNDIKSKKQDS